MMRKEILVFGFMLFLFFDDLILIKSHCCHFSQYDVRTDAQYRWIFEF
jgi:hypothetical protein